MAYVVTSILVQAKKADGSYVHVYEGGLLPDDVDEIQLAQLLEGEMVEAADTAEVKKPAKTAGEDKWRDYAISQGMTPGDAEAMSRDDLRDLYT